MIPGRPGHEERFAFNPPSPQTAGVSAGPGRAQIAAAPSPAPRPASRLASAFRRKTRAPQEQTAAEPRDWAFTWTLIFTAVLFLRPQDLFEPLDVLHLAELSAVFGLVSLVTGRLSRRESITRLTPEFIGVLVLGGVILVTAPFSIWFGGALGVFQDLYLKVVLVYLLAVNVLISPKRLERLTWLLVLALGYLALRAVVDYGRGVNVLRSGTRVMGSNRGLVQNPNDLALNMVAFLPLATLFAMGAGSMLRRGVAALCAISMVGAIVASGSRGGAVGFVVMSLVLAAFAARKRPGFVLAGFLALLCALPLAPKSYWERMASITDQSKDDVQSSQSRKRVMGESFDAFLQNPLTGVGAGQFKDWNPDGRVEAWHEAHNVWLQVASDLGIFGLAAFAFLVFRAFYGVVQTRRLLRRHRDAPAAEFLDAHSVAMAASLAGWVACAMFASVAYGWTFYYLLALAVAPTGMLRQGAPAVAATARAGRRAAAPFAGRARMPAVAGKVRG